MAVKPDPDSGINSWLEDELYQQYLRDHGAVDEELEACVRKTGNGAPAAILKPLAATSEKRQWARRRRVGSMRGATARVAHNMDVSLAVPLAASQRTIGKVIDENRRIINNHRTLLGKSKVSYTHIIGWAIVRALEYFPGLNHAYAEKGGEPFRIVRGNINLGVAVDVPGKDGGRNLLVPNIQDAGHIDFPTYVTAFDDLVARSRTGKLGAPDFRALRFRSPIREPWERCSPSRG
jgi:pyruvate/2-oxoglutarate dehydrogenase complex dihydrolipoamide acyltransferase (E2) component